MVLSACTRESDWLLAFIREFVARESPSTDRAPLDACGRWLAGELTRLGAAVERLSGAPTADHVLARWPGHGVRVLLVGHFDTVWPVGQIARMPIVERDGRLFGPGVLDMKAGLSIGILAARVVAGLTAEGARPRLSLLATSDEEVGSATSRAAIERLAQEHDAVLVLEPALPGGAVKTARKGVGEFEVIAHGVSSHAGANPGEGASAVREIARQILAIDALNDPARGVSVNVGVIDGGTRSNVVAERARALVDVRIARTEDAAAMEQVMRTLRSGRRPGAARGPRRNQPPADGADGGRRAVVSAGARGGGRAGRDLAEGATGGASDGNFTAALGVPTLDGLGALGDGPHALHEHVLINELAPRAALLAGLILRLGDNGRGIAPQRRP